MTGKEIAATGGVTTYITLDKGKRIWVTGNRMDSGVRETALDDAEDKCSGSSCYFPEEEPNTGETCCIKVSALKPIRD